MPTPSDHPALVLLRDTLAATGGAMTPLDVTRIARHAIDGAGYVLVPRDVATRALTWLGPTESEGYAQPEDFEAARTLVAAGAEDPLGGWRFS
jgi:hypothetical protein